MAQGPVGDHKPERIGPNQILVPPPMTAEERACNIGDHLEVVNTLDLKGTMEDPTPSLIPASGQIYRVVGLFGRGWDLVRISGEGPDELRVLNRDLPDFFRVMPSARNKE